jgi:rSAM/selenodomain-associated transferase 1
MPDIDSNPLNALLIFAKWPEPGKVKTRLSPPFSAQEASDVYRCMLMDTLENTVGLKGMKRMVFFDGDPERTADFRLLAPDAEVIRQEGNDLGERLANAFERAFSIGCQKVAVIGTDSPHMPIERITEAFDFLDEKKSDVVFGPSEDGGYYLIAMKEMNPELFREIPWSQSTTLSESISRTKSVGLRHTLLAPGFDLDTTDDLRRLTSLTEPGSAPQTRSFLANLSLKSPIHQYI